LRLLLDEMYSPAIAEALRERGHDALSAHDRPDLAAALDRAIFAAMQAEERVIVTNNVRDFAPLAREALERGSTFPGIVFTSDRSLPRNKRTIGTFAAALDALMTGNPAEDALSGQIQWLAESPPTN
jgi:predicted nuclease of predicted toxin-antitoxin system